MVFKITGFIIALLPKKLIYYTLEATEVIGTSTITSSVTSATPTKSKTWTA